MFLLKTYRKFVDFIERLIAVKFKSFNKTLKDLERSTSVKKIYFIHGALILTFALVLINNFRAASYFIIINFYPGVSTLQALKTMNADKCTQWLQYWAVFGFLRVIERIADPFLSFIPLYFFAKGAVIVWCYAPIKPNGSQIFYRKLMQPFMQVLQNNPLDRIGVDVIEKLEHKLKLKKNPLLGDNSVSTDADDVTKRVNDLISGSSDSSVDSATDKTSNSDLSLSKILQ